MVINNKSICQSRNVISFYANEIQMKGFNGKMKKESRKREGQTRPYTR